MVGSGALGALVDDVVVGIVVGTVVVVGEDAVDANVWRLDRSNALFDIAASLNAAAGRDFVAGVQVLASGACAGAVICKLIGDRL